MLRAHADAVVRAGDVGEAVAVEVALAPAGVGAGSLALAVALERSAAAHGGAFAVAGFTTCMQRNRSIDQSIYKK